MPEMARPGFDQGMIQAHRGQMAAGGPAGQHDGAVDAVRGTVGGEPVERGVDLGDDLGERGVGGQGIARQGRGPAACVRAGDQVGRIGLCCCAASSRRG